MRLQAIENGDGPAHLCCSALFRLFRASPIGYYRQRVALPWQRPMMIGHC